MSTKKNQALEDLEVLVAAFLRWAKEEGYADELLDLSPEEIGPATLVSLAADVEGSGWLRDFLGAATSWRFAPQIEALLGKEGIALLPQDQKPLEGDR